LKGLFITLEGCEGSGKTTLIQQLEQELKRQGYAVVSTREPGGSQLGNHIRQWLLAQQDSLKIGHLAELLLFLAARAQHIEELIEPALKQGQVVLCDRFNDSTIAYQSVLEGIQEQKVRELCQIVCGSVQPHLTLLLDVDPTLGLKRTKKLVKEHAKEGELDRIEGRQLVFHQHVSAMFNKLAAQEPERIYKIDAEQPQQVVFKDALQKIESLLACHDFDAV
jgi:dTMP kinase